jgi:hypothetical protein
MMPLVLLMLLAAARNPKGAVKHVMHAQPFAIAM